MAVEPPRNAYENHGGSRVLSRVRFTFSEERLPDWSFDIRDKTTPKGQNDLIEALGQEATLFDAIVELNLRARIP